MFSRWEHLIYQFGGHDHVIKHVIRKGQLVHSRSGEASPTIYSCYVNFLELMVCKNNQFLKKGIMIELSLTIEIYIAGVKNRTGFATAFS